MADGLASCGWAGVDRATITVKGREASTVSCVFALHTVTMATGVDLLLVSAAAEITTTFMSLPLTLHQLSLFTLYSVDLIPDENLHITLHLTFRL